MCAAVLLLPPHSPSWLFPLCRMSDPGFCSNTPPSCRRPEALRHKQNTQKKNSQTCHAPAREPTALSLYLSPFTFTLCLPPLSFTHRLQSERRTRSSSPDKEADSLPATTDEPLAAGVITPPLSQKHREADKCVCHSTTSTVSTTQL